MKTHPIRKMTARVSTGFSLVILLFMTSCQTGPLRPSGSLCFLDPKKYVGYCTEINSEEKKWEEKNISDMKNYVSMPIETWGEIQKYIYSLNEVRCEP